MAKRKSKEKNNDLQNITDKSKVTRIPLNTEVNSCALEG